MHTNEERVTEMHRRAEQMKKHKDDIRAGIYNAAVVLTGMAAVIVVAVILAGKEPAVMAAAKENQLQGSLLAGSNVTGFILVGIIAFLLGAAVTIFCFRYKKWREEREREEQS